MESNHLNKPIYRSKREGGKNYFKSDNKHKKQQKDKHEDVKKRPQNHKRWRRREIQKTHWERKGDIITEIVLSDLGEFLGKGPQA